MKKVVLITLMTISFLSAKAYEYPYLVFLKSEGGTTAVSVESLNITISNGKLIITNADGTQTFSLSELSKMYFSQDADLTGISTNNITDEAVEVFTLGGLALGNSDYTLHLDVIQNQKCSSWVLSDAFTQLFKENKKPSWEQVKALYRENLGFWETVEISKEEEKELKSLYEQACKGKSKDTKTMYKTINKLGDAGIELLNEKAHIGWTTHAHSAHSVPIFAIGVNANLFSGWHDNSEIVPLIKKAIND